MLQRFKPTQIIFAVFAIALVLLICYTTLIQTGRLNAIWNNFQVSLIPRERVDISIIYAPELESFMPKVIADFNQQFQQGINPITKQPLNKEDKLVQITGKQGSSGTVMQQIVNAYQNIKTNDVERPTIFAPSVSHWLQLANYQANAEIFKLDEARAVANAPVVMAIWESRLKAIQAKEKKQDIGWEELLKVFSSPNGWNDYGIEGRKTVYYGHTDPLISSTALSTLIQEFTASARYELGKKDLSVLSLSDINNQKVQSGVREIEALIKHYSSRTTEFKEYIAQGPNYVDFVALEENDLIYINQGKTEYKPPEKLVALYPKEGTFIHEHPFATLKAIWVNEEQANAAKLFTDYALTKEVQEQVLVNGFRPAGDEVALGYPIVSDLGVTPDAPKNILKVPEPAILSAIQQSWSFVKKRAEMYILLDSSGSMAGSKMESAKTAIKAFVDKLPVQNSVGLSSFSNEVRINADRAPLETNKAKVVGGVNEIIADGTTSIYDALANTIKSLSDDKQKGVIKAVVLLSDGEDTSSKISLNDLINLIRTSQNSDNPVLVIPVAYGDDADVNALNAIARASSTRVISGDTTDINTILQTVSSYF